MLLMLWISKSSQIKQNFDMPKTTISVAPTNTMLPLLKTYINFEDTSNVNVVGNSSSSCAIRICTDYKFACVSIKFTVVIRRLESKNGTEYINT